MPDAPEDPVAVAAGAGARKAARLYGWLGVLGAVFFGLLPVFDVVLLRRLPADAEQTAAWRTWFFEPITLPFAVGALCFALGPLLVLGSGALVTFRARAGAAAAVRALPLLAAGAAVAVLPVLTTSFQAHWPTPAGGTAHSVYMHTPAGVFFAVLAAASLLAWLRHGRALRDGSASSE